MTTDTVMPRDAALNVTNS